MRIAILGCGYLGLELGRQLINSPCDHTVVGVRRSSDGITAIEEAGLEAVRADVTDPDSLAAVPAVEALVFAASAGGRDAEAAHKVYVKGLETTVDHFAGRTDPPRRLVYTSSTAVFGGHNGDWVNEETPLKPSTEKTRVLAEAERVARERAPERDIRATVARLAGLYGPGRYRLKRYLEGPVTEGYLNMVHRDDAAGAIRFLLEESPGEDLILVTDDEPVHRWEFADWLADECGVERPPKYTKEERLEDGDLSKAARRRILTSKRCSNERLRGQGYEFSHPTFREGYREAIEDHCE